MLPVNRKRRASSFSLRILALCAQGIRQARIASLTKLASTIEAIKINAINLEKRGDQLMWVKRRQLGSGIIALFANIFFFLARARIHLWISLKRWQSWEVSCFRLLYGQSLAVFPESRRTVCVEMVPGKTLREWVNDGAFATQAIQGAGKELRRAHGLWSSELEDYWSHGDPHLENLLYDLESDQARLIDFELTHGRSLTARQRQADDVLVFLQDLMANVSAQNWVPFSLAFIEAYDQETVIEEVRRRLVVPHGWSAIWWKLRTDYLARGVMIERIESLNAALNETDNERTPISVGATAEEREEKSHTKSQRRQDKTEKINRESTRIGTRMHAKVKSECGITNGRD